MSDHIPWCRGDGRGTPEQLGEVTAGAQAAHRFRRNGGEDEGAAITRSEVRPPS
jgi:hypothetical protein